MKFKFEITQVIRNTGVITNAMGDNQDKAIFTVNYQVRFHSHMNMFAQEVLWAEDELDAYNKAKQIIKNKKEHRGI